MPKFVNRLSVIFNRKKNNFSSNGFTLIEILVVITIFAVAVSLITASFNTFEKNNRIKDAAAALRSNVRFIQNKALSGDRGASGLCGLASSAVPAPSTYTLVGWYLKVNPGVNNSYTIAGNCQITGTLTNVIFDSKTISLPTNVIISTVNAGNNHVNVLFKPVAGSIVVHAGATTPAFNDTANASRNLYASPLGPITIRLTSTDSTDIYDITIQQTGAVNETKI